VHGTATAKALCFQAMNDVLLAPQERMTMQIAVDGATLLQQQGIGVCSPHTSVACRSPSLSLFLCYAYTLLDRVVKNLSATVLSRGWLICVRSIPSHMLTLRESLLGSGFNSAVRTPLFSVTFLRRRIGSENGGVVACRRLAVQQDQRVADGRT